MDQTLRYGQEIGGDARRRWHHDGHDTGENFSTVEGRKREIPRFSRDGSCHAVTIDEVSGRLDMRYDFPDRDRQVNTMRNLACS